MGKSSYHASIQATKEVWGAVLASTLTTIAVFLPVVFIKEEAGQLFGDIAIAVSAAVGLSLVTAIAVIPVLANIFFNKNKKNENIEEKSVKNKLKEKIKDKIKIKKQILKPELKAKIKSISIDKMLVNTGNFFVKYMLFADFC